METVDNITIQEPECSSQTNNGNEASDIGNDVLEYFNNLNWNVVEKTEFQKCWTRFLPCEEDNITKSHALALIYSQRYPYPEKEYDIKEIKNESGSSDYYVPGVQEKTVFYPSNSILSRQEQNLLYALMCKIQFNNPPPNNMELCQYKELMLKVEKEHNNFQHFVVLQWMKLHCHRSLEIPDSVHEYINKLWKTQLKQCLALYPHLFMKKTFIPLTLNDPNKDHSVMELVKVVTLKGYLQKLMMPKLKNACYLITDPNELCQIKQVCSEEEMPAVKPRTSSVPQVSIDPVVDMCIEKENIDVVITPSAIKTIVDTYQDYKDWILPVTVKNVLKVNGELNKKVVIIDKKLPPCGMSIYDKNVRHAKIASKWALILRKSPHLLRAERKTRCNKRKLTEYDDDTVTEVVEEFGVDEPSSVTSCEAKVDHYLSSVAIEKDKACTKLENLSILENGIEETKKENSELENMSQNNKKGKSITDSPAATPPASDTLLPHKLAAKRQSLIRPLRKYAIWELHKSTHFNMSKQEQRSLKVLVRSRVDGDLIHFKNNRRFVNNVYVSSKLEYQPEFGASKMSKSEIVREYVDLFIRETDLCRVRVVGHTKELMLFEVKTLQEIKDCLQHGHNVETRKVFDPLYAVLTKLIDLPVGRYMLQHTSKMEAFSQLLTESAQHIDFNLMNHCESPETTEVNLPAAQIDPFLLTKIHFRERHPPAIFRPIHPETGRFLKKPSFVVGKRKRGKKSRGKNTRGRNTRNKKNQTKKDTEAEGENNP